MNFAEFRRILEEERVSVQRARAQARASAAIVELDQTSVGRVSRVDALQQQALAKGLLARLETRERRIEAALARIDAGTFGQCCECGVALDMKQLLSDATTLFCAECAAERADVSTPGARLR
ncbi:MAG: TraR/DksA family transcriptional regulator [Casimicrobiaceae bacterium]